MHASNKFASLSPIYHLYYLHAISISNLNLHFCLHNFCLPSLIIMCISNQLTVSISTTQVFSFGHHLNNHHCYHPTGSFFLGHTLGWNPPPTPNNTHLYHIGPTTCATRARNVQNFYLYSFQWLSITKKRKEKTWSN